MIKSIGLQLWSVKDYLKSEDEVKSTFKKLKEMGYDEVQTAGAPVPYEDLARIAKENGLKIVGTHYSFEKMENDIEGAIADHKAMETTNMGIGGYHFKTEEDVNTFIEKANKIADRISKEGMKFTYHNHSHEFVEINGKTVWQRLVDGLDKDKTSFVLDTYWVQAAGGDVVDWIEKLAGRIDIIHLKDMGMWHTDHTGSDTIEKYVTPVGSGNMNFERIIEASVKAGVKYFCVEFEQEGWDKRDTMKCVEMCSDYLHKNFM